MKSQRTKLLDILKNSPTGVNSYYATYELGIKQAPTRIKELREAGYAIHSVTQKDRSVNWVLSDSPVPVESPRVEDQYVFLPDGRAVLRAQMEPRQEVLV